MIGFDEEGRTALHYAAEFGGLSEIQIFLPTVDINALDIFGIPVRNRW